MADQVAGFVTTFDTGKLKAELDKQRAELNLLKQLLTEEMKKRMEDREDLIVRQNTEVKKTKEFLKFTEDRIKREFMHAIYRMRMQWNT